MNNNRFTATLLLACPDQRGLVATVSDFIYRHNGNIIHADQHTDQEKGVFLQRVEWDMHGFAIPRAELITAFGPVARQFTMTWEVRFSDYVPKIAILVSREPHCMHDLLSRWRMGQLSAEVALVISNHEDLEDVVEGFGVEYLSLPVGRDSKPQQEALITQRLEAHQVDLVVLARYMQVLSREFVARYSNKIINIHHSFLPAFAGGRPYHQAYERGVKIIGATAHYVTAELDQGPIIEQDVVRISHRDSVPDLVRKGRDLETVVLARAVTMHLRSRVLVYGNKTVVFD